MPALTFRSRIVWLTLLVVCALAILGFRAQAAEVSVKASVDRRTTDVGTPVQLQIMVTGARATAQPPEFAVDGLNIEYSGVQQSRVQRIVNGQSTLEISLLIRYQVTAAKEGSFTIPATTITVDGK